VTLRISGQLASHKPLAVHGLKESTAVVDSVEAGMGKAELPTDSRASVVPGTQRSSTFWLLPCNRFEYRGWHVNIELAAAGRSVGAHADLSCGGDSRWRVTLSIPNDHEFG
jgi:hypothetical protein